MRREDARKAIVRAAVDWQLHCRASHDCGSCPYDAKQRVMASANERSRRKRLCDAVKALEDATD